MSSQEARQGEAMRISSNGEWLPAIRVLRSSKDALSSIRIDAVGTGEVPAEERAVAGLRFQPHHNFHHGFVGEGGADGSRGVSDSVSSRAAFASSISCSAV